jgi:hypothetical protein
LSAQQHLTKPPPKSKVQQKCEVASKTGVLNITNQSLAAFPVEALQVSKLRVLTVGLFPQRKLSLTLLFIIPSSIQWKNCVRRRVRVLMCVHTCMQMHSAHAGARVYAFANVFACAHALVCLYVIRRQLRPEPGARRSIKGGVFTAQAHPTAKQIA